MRQDAVQCTSIGPQVVLAELLKVSETIAVLCPVITPSGLHLEVGVPGNLKLETVVHVA